jgi:hypothetical protein
MKELINDEGPITGELGLDATQISCAGSHHQFRDVEKMVH